PRVADAALPSLSVDAADVPLQWLVLPLDGLPPGGDAYLPAADRQRLDLRGLRRAWRDPSLRRADHHEPDRQRPAGGAAALHADGADDDGGLGTARGDPRADGRAWHRGHPCLR